jgi:hypothetical protein
MSLTLGKSWKVETAAVELSKKKKKTWIRNDVGKLAIK